MALSTSAYLSRSKYVIAISGATGNLGSIVSKTILMQPYRTHFSRVVLLVRDLSSPLSQELNELGGKLIQINIDDPVSLNQSLKGVDVLINVFGTRDHDAKEKILDAAIANKVLLYIPSEFGVDHRVNEFEHVEWETKRKHIERASTEGDGKMKAIAIYPGLFLEDSIGPWFGLDTKNKTYTAVGSPDTPITFTSKGDVAKAVAQVVLKYFSFPEAFPDDIRIAGTSASFKQIGDIMSHESGDKIDVASLGDLAAYEKELQEKFNNEGVLAGYIRLLMGQGKLDFSSNNQNEMINPEGKQWKWKSMEDYGREVKGRPWIGF